MPPRNRSQRLLASPTTPPTSKKLVFSDDVDLDVSLAESAEHSKRVSEVINSDSDDDEDGAPVEESNARGKQAFEAKERKTKEDEARLKEKRSRANAKRQEAAEARKRKEEEEEAAKRVEEESASGSDSEDDDDDDDEDEDEAPSDLPSEDDLDADLDEDVDSGPSSSSKQASTSLSPTSATRLDPALFAAAFARRASDEGTSLGSNTLASTSSSTLPSSSSSSAKKVRSVAKGRDGQAFKKLKDGRTVVRALEDRGGMYDSSSAKAENEESGDPKEEIISLAPRDPTSLPNARIRAFKKRRLGLSSAPSNPSSMLGKGKGTAQVKKTNKDVHDPLGLEDPAFLPGGEFYGVGLEEGGKGFGFGLTGKPRRRGKGKEGQSGNGKGNGDGRGRRGQNGRIEARRAIASTSFGRSSGAPILGFASST